MDEFEIIIHRINLLALVNSTKCVLCVCVALINGGNFGTNK